MTTADNIMQRTEKYRSRLKDPSWRQLVKNWLRVSVFAILTIPITIPSQAGVMDTLVRPADETVKGWIAGKTIVVVKHGWYWPDKSEKLDPAKIRNFSFVSMQLTDHTLNPMAQSEAVAVYEFDYESAGKVNHYALLVKFNWTLHVGSVERKSESVDIVGPK